MSPRARPHLRVERLEHPDVPATFGIDWPDGAHLPLSLAPDGTPINGGASSLFQLFGDQDPAVWQAELLRAFQTWAAYANINIGLVSDGGQAFGTVGSIQGDTRFGD